MKLVIEAISDRGVVRTTNEDLVLVGNDILRNAAERYEFDFSTYEHPFIIAIADGLGGRLDGAAGADTGGARSGRGSRRLRSGDGYRCNRRVQNARICGNRRGAERYRRVDHPGFAVQRPGTAQGGGADRVGRGRHLGAGQRMQVGQ